MKVIKNFLLLCLICILGMVLGCSNARQENKTVNKTLVIFSELEPKLTDELLLSFNKSEDARKAHITVKAVYDLKDESCDLYLSERSRLLAMKQQGMLAPLKFTGRKHIPKSLTDKDGCWFGVFFDSYVFLVNQRYAREEGQENIKGWESVVQLRNPRIAMENLSNSKSTKSFLAALAERYGEQAVLNYLWNLNQRIPQYGRFPFSPVRQAVTGDVDIAVTRESFVYKHLDNSFPAYVVFPMEGTPVDLYGIGFAAKSKNKQEAKLFCKWVFESDQWQHTSQRLNTGFRFIFPRGIDEEPINEKLLWLNNKYVDEKSQEQLLNKWLSGVRFSR